MSNGIRLDISQVMSVLATMPPKFDAAAELLAKNGAQKMERYAKANRLWTDRTADARKFLKGTSYRIPRGFRMEISHGVYYGICLEGTNNPSQSAGPQTLSPLDMEFAYERKYAILAPTVREVGEKEIKPAFENFLYKVVTGR